MPRRVLLISIALLLSLSRMDADAGSSLPDVKLTPTESGIADYFGRAVALSLDGETLVVGAMYDVGGIDNPPEQRGKAYVFERKDGKWLETARLTAADGHLGDQFGFSVDINSDGRRIVIGATESGRLTPPPRKVGAAYVFIHQGDTWVETAKFSGDEEFSQFGRSVAISRDTVVVGAEEEDASRGAAYVFAEEGGQWSRQAKLSASDAQPGDVLGGSVAISGDTIVVGARLVNSRAGAAYVFERSGTSWVQTAKLNNPRSGHARYFGLSVAIDRGGRTLAIGAPGAAGTVFVFERHSAGWAETAALDASRWGCWWFGRSVAINAGRIVVGAPIWDSSNNLMARTGKVFLFRRAGTEWKKETEFQPEALDDGDSFGSGVAISNSTIVAGAPHFFNSEHGYSTGAAYIIFEETLRFFRIPDSPAPSN